MKKEEILKMNNNILNELLTTNVMSVEKLKEEFTQFINSLVIDVNEDNISEYKKMQQN